LGRDPGPCSDRQNRVADLLVSQRRAFFLEHSCYNTTNPSKRSEVRYECRCLPLFLRLSLRRKS
jgi:hypothetical protein